MGFWFRRKYNLPPNDPRYLDLSTIDLMSEYWAHYYADNGDKGEVEDEDFDLDEVLKAMEQDDSDDWEEVDLNGE